MSNRIRVRLAIVHRYPVVPVHDRVSIFEDTELVARLVIVVPVFICIPVEPDGLAPRNPDDVIPSDIDEGIPHEVQIRPERDVGHARNNDRVSLARDDDREDSIAHDAFNSASRNLWSITAWRRLAGSYGMTSVHGAGNGPPSRWASRKV